MADKRDNNRKVVDKTTKTAKKSELVQISRREQRLRERLLTVDEDAVHDEKRLHDNSERRKARLTRKINATRARQEQGWIARSARLSIICRRYCIAC